MSTPAMGFFKVAQFTSAFVPIVKVTEVRGSANGFSPLVYQCRMNTDWDGAPTAYGFDNPSDARPAGLVWDSKQQKYVRQREDHFQRDLKPLEAPALAGSLRDATDNVAKGKGLFFDHDFSWVGVVSALPSEVGKGPDHIWLDERDVLRDRHGRFPVVQKDGPTKGYYVSQSGSFAISQTQQKATPGFKFLQTSYWDAASIPYCVWPSKLGHGLSLGDFGLVISNRTGRSQGFFFADTGSTNKLGECSGYLSRSVLGSALDNSPSSVLNNGEMVSFLVFPRSGGGSARQGQETRIDAAVRAQIRKLSGDAYAEEFIRFLSMGADPDTFARTNYASIKSGIPAATYNNINRALKEWGFQSARRPIDMNAPLGR